MRQVHLPKDIDELWQVLSENPKAVPWAGGTDLLARMRNRLVDPPALVCLERVEELKGVEDHGDKVLIRACTTHTQLLRDPLIQKQCPLLHKALKVLGSPLIRNMGTIGGNIVTASPAGDTLPPLYLSDAELELWSRNGSRLVPISDFIKGPGQTALRPREILAGIWVRRDRGVNLHHYEKVGQRKALAISIVSLAASLHITETGIIERVRLAWGSVGPKVIMSEEVERALTGRPLTRETLAKAVPLAHKAVRPIDDIRASAQYRRIVAGNLLFRLLGHSEQSIPSAIEGLSSGARQ
jgi:xanthine dehydrogenase FAD-binding subunit